MDTNEKLNYCIKRLPELAEELDDAWEEDNHFLLNEDKVEAVETKIKLLLCEITEHDYGFDQCGYWQHKFCYKCSNPQYPDLAIQSCGELSKKMKGMSEQEYLTKQTTDQDQIS